MRNTSQVARETHKRDLVNEGLAVLRRPLLRILFIQGEPGNLRRCLQELKRADLRARADAVSTLEEFTKQLNAKSYDLIIADYPSALKWKGRELKLLKIDGRHVPVIFITRALSRETVADLTRKGTAECIQKENIGHLPVVIRRVLNEETLRGQRDRAEEKLRHSEAHYRALVGNLTYGIFHCTLKGKLLDANPALMTMLGCTTKEELLEADLTNEIISDPLKRKQLLGCPEEMKRSDALEMDWKRRDGKPLKVRLSGREVIGADEMISGYEIIAEDVTKQRELEDHLRQEAAKDSLTGLANYRTLVGTLDREIKRSPDGPGIRTVALRLGRSEEDQ